MMVIGNVFPKLQTLKILVRPLSKKRRFRKRFDCQHLKVLQILVKSLLDHFYHVFSSFWGTFISKMSPLVLGQILGVFVDTLPADAKCPVGYYENLKLPIQMQLSGKRKTFSEFFVPLVDSALNFKQFEKKNMIAIANVFPKLQNVKILVRALSKNHRFRKHFDSQHVKVSQIYAKSPW